MMLIPCPHCGLRDEDEFSYGGDATVVRPVDPEALDDEAWTSFLFLRDNPRGPHDELWLHAGGCRQWLLVRRDTRTRLPSSSLR